MLKNPYVTDILYFGDRYMYTYILIVTIYFLSKMNDYIFRLVNASKGRAEVVQIGQSYEGRDMYCVKVRHEGGL